MASRNYAPIHQGRRVWEFLLRKPRDDPGRWWKIKEKLGFVDTFEREAEQSLNNLRGTRDNHPYRYKFRFISIKWEDGDEGYRVELECFPAVREKMDQLEDSIQGLDPRGAVRTCKSEIKDIATEVGLQFLREPTTPAVSLQETVTEHLRMQIQELKYGHQVLKFTDEADEALKYSLTRPALSAYIHAIEWAVITYIEAAENKDIIEEERYGDGKEWGEIVGRLKSTNQATETTVSALEAMKTERIWMAHHKDGKVSDIEVRRVKKRLSILLEELFL